MENKIYEIAAEKIIKADACIITSGAGMGVDSGLPDFRGDEGFWRAYPRVGKLGIPFSRMANPDWFIDKPELAWAFYGHRLNMYRETQPHDGFYQLLEIAETKPGGYFVFTSNVDGHFQKANYSVNRIEECHGSIHHFQCITPCTRDIWDASEINIEIDDEEFLAQPPLPKCMNCNSLARPNILMFGDWSWISRRTDEQSQNFDNWLEKNSQSDHEIVIIEVGAGKAVPTVRWKSERIARNYNGSLIRINPRDADVPADHFSVKGNAAESINGIYQIWKNLR